MSTPSFPFGMDPESLRDAPLFQELQRVMSGSSGPVQWELARQMAVAGAAEAGSDTAPDAAANDAFAEIARVAELHVLELTELAPTGDVLHVEVVRRADWIATAMEDYRPLVELAAGRMSDALVRALAEQRPAEDGRRRATRWRPSVSDPRRPSSGSSARCCRRRRSDRCSASSRAACSAATTSASPAQAAGPVRFVLANIEGFERDWSLDPREFRTFVALHQIAHRLQSAQPWLPAHATAAVDDFCSSMTIDVDAIRDRFANISPEDPEAFSAAFADEEGSMFGIVLDDEQRLKLDRVRALIGAVEGYGDHVAATIGHALLGTYPKIEEAMRRHREDEELDPIFARLLGVDVGREHVAAGRAFCETVVELTDEATLGRMWGSADALPGLAELQEPRLWLARTV